MNLSKHFTLADITRSETAVRLGIDNSLPPDMLDYWEAGCDYLEAVQTITESYIHGQEFGRARGVGALRITSGFRCAELNKRIAGSSKTSMHTGKWRGLYCCAFDLQTVAGNDKLFHAVRNSQLDFDQLIWEYGNDVAPAWVHIGFVFGKVMRKELLRKRVGTVKYEAWK